VEGEHDPGRLVTHGTAVDNDPVVDRIDPAGRRALEGAIEADTAVGDPALRLAA
jgi:hypothetical protein